MTAGVVLDRHGLVTRGRKARYHAQGTGLSNPRDRTISGAQPDAASAPNFSANRRFRSGPTQPLAEWSPASLAPAGERCAAPRVPPRHRLASSSDLPLRFLSF